MVGAHAVYWHTGDVGLPVAPHTTDADFALDPQLLLTDPSVAEAMTSGGFTLGIQPGEWRSASGVVVDLLVPASLAGPGRRGARLAGHGKRAAHKASGLEACLVDNVVARVGALEEAHDRSFDLKIAGPAALIVTKVHKLTDPERVERGRVSQKDALDVYSLLVKVPLKSFTDGFAKLLSSELAAEVTRAALEGFAELFATESSRGVRMVVAATAGLEDEALITQATTVLAGELLASVGTPHTG